MSVQYERTPEDQAYARLYDDNWDSLSEAARTVAREANSVASAEHLVRTYMASPDEYDAALEKMRTAAKEITDREAEVLKQIWLAGLSAGASVDPDDYETLIGYRIYRGDQHRFYRLSSDMIEKVLEERNEAARDAERQRKCAEQGPIDYSDVPF